MEALLEAIMQAGGTGGVVAGLLLAFKTYETRKTEKNGGSVYSRISILEEKVRVLGGEINEINVKVHEIHREFCEAREEFRLIIAKQQARAEALREVKNG